MAIWILCSAGIIVLLQLLLFSLFNFKGLTYTRSFSARAVSEGEHVKLVEVIRNRKLLPVPWVRAESRISRFLKFGAGTREDREDDREIDADMYHKSVFYLGPFSQITRRHDVTCLKRGHYYAGSVALTAGDVLALNVNTKQVQSDCEIDVYPSLLSDDELDPTSTRWQGELAVKRWIMPDPFLVSGIRDYRAGDPMRDIHWGATARTGELQVKVRDYTADPRMLVVLNVQASEEQWSDLMDYEQAGIEYGIRAAATLCKRALDAGVEAGFASNACYLGEKNTGKTVYVTSQRSDGQLEVILTAMARLEIHREVNFPLFLEGLSAGTNTDILVMSLYDSEQIQARLQMLRAAGNSVTFMKLNTIK